MKYTVEIFTTGCLACTDVVRRMRSLCDGSCQIRVLDMRNPNTERHARELGVESAPAIVVDGVLLAADPSGGYSDGVLRSICDGAACG